MTPSKLSLGPVFGISLPPGTVAVGGCDGCVDGDLLGATEGEGGVAD
jgi:hypothetical protein